MTLERPWGTIWYVTTDAFLADCRARLAFDLLSHTWNAVVLWALRDGPRRPVELRPQIGGISSKVLTQTLRRLQSHGLVERQSYSGHRRALSIDSLLWGAPCWPPLTLSEHGLSSMAMSSWPPRKPAVLPPSSPPLSDHRRRQQMSAQPRVREVMWMSARTSPRIRRQRNQCRRANARSSNPRWEPSADFFSMPRRVISDLTPSPRTRRRCLAWSQPRPPRTLSAG